MSVIRISCPFLARARRRALAAVIPVASGGVEPCRSGPGADHRPPDGNTTSPVAHRILASARARASWPISMPYGSCGIFNANAFFVVILTPWTVIVREGTSHAGFSSRAPLAVVMVTKMRFQCGLGMIPVLTTSTIVLSHPVSSSAGTPVVPRMSAATTMRRDVAWTDGSAPASMARRWRDLVASTWRWWEVSCLGDVPAGEPAWMAWTWWCRSLPLLPTKSQQAHWWSGSAVVGGWARGRGPSFSTVVPRESPPAANRTDTNVVRSPGTGDSTLVTVHRWPLGR
jgi:hypothetical protein